MVYGLFLKFIPLATVTAALSFGSVVSYTSETAWLDATTGATSYFVENFANNQIDTPGLSVTNCSWDCLVPGGFDFIANDTYYAADGKYAEQVNGKIGSYVTTTFNLPANINGIGFEMYAPQSANSSALGLIINTTSGFDYWQLGALSEQNSPAFPQGFLGFVTSGADITSVGFIGGSAQISEILGADPTTAPEPRTWGLLGGALLGIGALRLGKRRTACSVVTVADPPEG